MDYEFHEVASIFPLMGNQEFDELKQDIKQNGLLEPIWLYEGKIIDGRNRYLACQAVAVVPTYREWNGQGSLVSFVMSLNLHRRHLTSSQRAVIALDVLPMLEKEAHQRLAAGAFQTNTGTQLIAEADKGEAREKAAELAQTNRQYVSDAKLLRDEAPDLLDKVRDGELSIPSAKEELLVRRNPHVSFNSGENEWYTPPKYADAASLVMGGIDLDPASTESANRYIKAKMFFTSENSGLIKDWWGNVWMNPPYSQPLISDFCEKLVEELVSGRVVQACVLVNNATETGWYQHLLSCASSVCFIRGRVKFIDKAGRESGAPLQGQTILYFGSRTDEFAKGFAEFGKILYVC